jgi:hypothetical protein
MSKHFMRQFKLVDEKDYAIVLINQIYKILPLYEERAIDGYKHVDSTIFELNGLEDHFVEFHMNPEFIRMIGTLEGLYDILLLPCLSDDKKETQKEHDLVKREVLKCTGWVKKLAKLEDK